MVRKPFADRFRCVIVALEAVKIEVVTQVSSLRKLGAFARIAADYAGRNRTLKALMGAVSTTARSFAHAWHQLWLEVTGTVFLSIAVFGAAAIVREYTKYHAGQTTMGRVAILICFTLVFAWFGLSSFWRVKRRRRAG